MKSGIQNFYNLMPLMLAAHQGHGKIASLLLNHQAAIGNKNNDGLTALEYAEELGQTEIVELLQNAGV